MNQVAKYSIVFSDVDGTLLNKNRELSDFTIRQIKKIYHEQSVNFVMVSARMPKGMQHLYNQLSINTPIICYNGALILNSLYNGFTAKNILYSNSIDYEVAQAIYQKVRSEKLHFSIFSNDNWYANQTDEWTLKEENNTKVKCTIYPEIDYLIAHLKQNQQPVHKLMVMGDLTKIDSCINFTIQNYNKNITSYRSKDTYIEISPATSNKASGCLVLMNYLGIKPTNAIAFGDNYNDIEMLKLVELGIAMENAPHEVKIHAKQVAPSNLLDGVAITINSIFE